MLSRFLIAGALGWAVEAVANGKPRYSTWLGGEKLKLPFLPVYGAGALVIDALDVRSQSLPVRAGAYAVALTGLELGACLLERSLGAAQWSYGPSFDCIDGKHTLAWTGLALLTEGL